MKTKLLAAGTALSFFLGQLIQMPVEQQNAIIAPVIAIVPPFWQSWIGLLLKAGGAWMAYATFARLRNMHPPDAPNINKPDETTKP
jgi:hypothetical protein